MHGDAENRVRVSPLVEHGQLLISHAPSPQRATTLGPQPATCPVMLHDPETRCVVQQPWGSLKQLLAIQRGCTRVFLPTRLHTPCVNVFTESPSPWLMMVRDSTNSNTLCAVLPMLYCHWHLRLTGESALGWYTLFNSLFTCMHSVWMPPLALLSLAGQLQMGTIAYRAQGAFSKAQRRNLCVGVACLII